MNTPWEGVTLNGIIQKILDARNAFGNGGDALIVIKKRDQLYDLVNRSNLLPEA